MAQLVSLNPLKTGQYSDFRYLTRTLNFNQLSLNPLKTGQYSDWNRVIELPNELRLVSIP